LKSESFPDDLMLLTFKGTVLTHQNQTSAIIG